MKSRKRKRLLVLASGLALAGALLAGLPASSQASGYQELLFSDPDGVSSDLGPGPQPATESSDFTLTNGGVHWFSGGQVEYLVDAPSAADATAVDLAVATLDGFITTRAFAHNNATTQLNPCTGQPNSIRWGPIDGPGGVLAATRVCFNSATKEIVGFRILFDSGDAWATDGASTAIDVQNVGTHEMGHVAGLDHVHAPRDKCLTMYTFSSSGETQKRTLGLGDKLGLHKLYNSADVTAGACGS